MHGNEAKTEETHLNITQNTLMKQVADRENVNLAMVRRLFRSTEDIIFDYLSSAAPSEELNIKLLSGIQIRRRYITGKKCSKGMFRDQDCPEHVNTKAALSKYYNEQINRKLFDRQQGQGRGETQTVREPEKSS